MLDCKRETFDFSPQHVQPSLNAAARHTADTNPHKHLISRGSHEIGDTMSTVLSTHLLEQLVLLVRKTKTDDPRAFDES